MNDAGPFHVGEDPATPPAPRGVGHLRGAVPFPTAARAALTDSQLRRNIGKATATIRAKRADVVAEVADWEQLREAGRALKATTMARLPELLTQLEERVTAAGGNVHWARDASEANRIVTDIVRGTDSDEVVKVKSMATQEIGLNEALAEAGIAAIETDLAELIVQLGDDAPSHILVPAIHRNRAEIREIFLRGMPGVDPGLTDEPRRLAMAARAHLRRKFLSARVGVSGANFAVAETGTLSVVESEGNGRMCLTLPGTLITVMGIEKLVPTWQDLEVFLQLLPRSSTGERMNPYTSMWTGVHPDDGPTDVHLVLLDNGRTAALADEVGRQALHCIRCSACLNVCPVYERTGGHAYGSVYPGPIGAILSPQLTGVEDNASLPFASSLCGACYDVCPVKINIPEVLVHLRARHVEQRRATRTVPNAEELAMAAAGWVMADPDRYATAQRATRAGRILAAGADRIRALPPPLSAWTASRDVPAPPTETFRDWWTRTRGAQRRGRVRGGSLGGRRTRRGRGHDAARSDERRPPATSARDEVLARIRSALGDVDNDTIDIPRDYERGRAHTSGGGALLDLLDERLTDYGAAVRRTTHDEVADAVARAIADGLAHGPDSVGTHPRIVVPHGLPDAWTSTADCDVVADDDLGVGDLDGCHGVVTAAAIAIADTGTLVLDGSSDQGRRALTLVPDLHVCVVRADQVVATVPEGVARLDPTRPLTWISGPSATSDIELDRVEGVHGPRTLQVLLVTG